MTKNAKPALPLVRCAVYTRKSSEEGLQQEFNSLDAPRQAAEAFTTAFLAPGPFDDGPY